MTDKVIDWKDLWFYVENQSLSLPRRSAGPPVKRASWNSRGEDVDQVHFLLGEIDLLKKKVILIYILPPGIPGGRM